MLDGDVDVGQDLGRVSNRLNELVGHTLGLQVEDADPAAVGTHDLGDLPEKPGQSHVIALQVATPDARVLTDENDLTDAALHEVTHLVHDLLWLARVVATTDVGDCAEGTEAVATIRDLYVGGGALDGTQEGALGNAYPRGSAGLDAYAQNVADNLDDTVLVVGVHEGSNLGKLLLQLATIAGGHATAHDDGLLGKASLVHVLGYAKQDSQGLLRCRLEEGTGVDEDDVGVLGTLGLTHAGAQKEGAHAIGIHLVLCTAQGDEVKALVPQRLGGVLAGQVQTFLFGH